MAERGLAGCNWSLYRWLNLGGTPAAAREYRDALTGMVWHRDMPVSDALGRFPVALLLRERARDG